MGPSPPCDNFFYATMFHFLTCLGMRGGGGGLKEKPLESGLSSLLNIIVMISSLISSPYAVWRVRSLKFSAQKHSQQLSLLSLFSAVIHVGAKAGESHSVVWWSYRLTSLRDGYTTHFRSSVTQIRSTICVPGAWITMTAVLVEGHPLSCVYWGGRRLHHCSVS